jgi:hypothetical protein
MWFRDKYFTTAHKRNNKGPGLPPGSFPLHVPDMGVDYGAEGYDSDVAFWSKILNYWILFQLAGLKILWIHGCLLP